MSSERCAVPVGFRHVAGCMRPSRTELEKCDTDSRYESECVVLILVCM
jgi:hypothetical protein